ncbi:hypothetical protein FSARC_4998 [Fusarium sarcochroum]|uniref:SCP domain-containing protein n=1 Tax=Fusarium sarcochroum TaxID=1208366 RepID=A0A8H4U0A9_9HYPO|nr:hypothetical protein FSARC_4998 [Fusarium sarcochroum]
MLLSTLYAQSSLLLAAHFLTGVTGAPSASGLNADISIGGHSSSDFLPEAEFNGDSSDGTSSDSVSAENDDEASQDYRKYHVLNIGLDLLQLGVAPAICDPNSKSNSLNACTVTRSSSKSSDKRSLLQKLTTRALTTDKKEALRLHNEARAKVKVPALVWDPSLEAAAKAYAEKIAKAGKLSHSASSDRPNQGENLAYAYSSGGIKLPNTGGATAWLNEKKYYHGETIPKGNFSDYGHYTQAVWKTSTKFGIHSAQDSKGAWYTVGRYSGPGNIVGKKPY